MGRFESWLHEKGKYQTPSERILLAIGCSTLVVMFGPLAWLFHDFALPLFVGAIALWIPCALPMALRWRETRHQLWLAPRGFAGSVKHWTKKLGDGEPLLDAAALDLEQIESLAERTPLGKVEGKALARAAEARLWRMFELNVAAPARKGFTLAGAESQIAEDARWIAEARRLIERTIDEAAKPDAGEALGELRTFVEAREAALAELRN